MTNLGFGFVQFTQVSLIPILCENECHLFIYGSVIVHYVYRIM